MNSAWGQHEGCPGGRSRRTGDWFGWWHWKHPPDAEIPDEEQMSDESYAHAVRVQIERGWYECDSCGERRYAGPRRKVVHQAPPPWETEVIPLVPPAGWANPR